MTTNGRPPTCFAVDTAGGSLGQLAPTPTWTEVEERGHSVQFYEQDEFLIDILAQYVGAGLGAGESAIVIATPAHRQALEAKLQERCIDVETLRAQGRYFPLDAAETLARFMLDDTPDPMLFEKAISDVLRQAGRDGRRIRAFGEMVALLWADGHTAAAIALEELWNELGRKHAFTLLCAYPMNGFNGVDEARRFHEVCCAHTRVVPAESYTSQVDERARLRFISALQQKAGTLEAEIEERRRAENAAREQHTKLAMAAAIAQIGIWELDLKSSTLSCSEACRAHFGLSAEATIGYEPLLRKIHPADRSMVRTKLQRAIAQGGDYSAEFRVVLPDGGQHWLAAMGRCLPEGAPRVLGVTLDITARRAQEEVLERLVTDRTAELRATVGELEAFSYSISHDMRAPLRSMQGFAGVLIKELGDKLDGENRRYLERIVVAGERMDRLIQDVLTFSRVTRAELKLEAVNLDHLVRGIVECYPTLQPPHADVKIQGDLPAVLGHAAAITQCVSNLLGNAVKFVSPGAEPNVRIWAERIEARAVDRSKHGAREALIRLYVRDNGIGIPVEAQDKIFTIFHRLTRDYEGTGIGLAIVKKAAERMGGGVGLQSELGQGSTFWLDLPAADHA